MRLTSKNKTNLTKWKCEVESILWYFKENGNANQFSWNVGSDSTAFTKSLLKVWSWEMLVKCTLGIMDQICKWIDLVKSFMQLFIHKILNGNQQHPWHLKVRPPQDNKCSGFFLRTIFQLVKCVLKVISFKTNADLSKGSSQWITVDRSLWVKGKGF